MFFILILLLNISTFIIKILSLNIFHENTELQCRQKAPFSLLFMSIVLFKYLFQTTMVRLLTIEPL